MDISAVQFDELVHSEHDQQADGGRLEDVEDHVCEAWRGQLSLTKV